MDAKERIIKTTNHEIPDKIPSFELSIDNLEICEHYDARYPFQGGCGGRKFFYYLCWGNTKVLTRVFNYFAKKKATIKMAIKPIISLFLKIGIDTTCIPVGMFPVQYSKTGYVDEFAKRFEFKKNPNDGMDMAYYMEGVLKDFEDYEAFYNEHPLDPDDPMRETTYKLSKKLEEKAEGKIYLMPSLMGMMESTWEGFGLEKFSLMLARPKNIKKVFDDRGKFAVEMVKRIVEWGETGPILVYDDYGYKTGLFMSPRNYRKYVFPWMERICDTAHKGGLKVMLHSCGDIIQIFEDLIKAGVDGFHPIEATTANPDYDIFKLKEKYGDKVTFIGNVSPQDLADSPPEDIRDYTKKLIEKVAPGGGYIFSSGHSINPAVKLENYLTMRETLEKYGTYPIKNL